MSEHTKSASLITNEWQKKCKVDNIIEDEVKVPTNNERIDIVDFKEQTAYELKVSGKNSHHEFYKDLMKVLTYNCIKKEKPLKKFVFLTESEGIENIKKRFTKEIQVMIETTHKIEIILKSIN